MNGDGRWHGSTDKLTKEKIMLRVSQSQSFDLIRKLEVDVETLSQARIEDKKKIQELERELKNCSQEIDFLQDQLNSRNTEINCLDEHVRILELKLAEMLNFQEMASGLQKELGRFDSERLCLMQELDSKEVELKKATSCIENLEESVSYDGLESQFEIESMKLDLISLEQNYFEAKKSAEEILKENVQMNAMIREAEVQLQHTQKAIQCLGKDNEELRKKLETRDVNSRKFCQKIEEYLAESLEDKDGLKCKIQPDFYELETKLVTMEDMSTCGEVLGPLLPKLAKVAASHENLKCQVKKMSHQIHDYELLLQQLKDELREEKLKAEDEAEDLAQEMAELRYQITGILEQESKRRVCIEQASLQRIAELEAQIQDDKGSQIRDEKRSFTAVKALH